MEPDRIAQTLERMAAAMLTFEIVPDLLEDPGADKQFAGSGAIAEPRGEIYIGADDAVLHASGGADVAGDHLTATDAEADSQFEPAALTESRHLLNNVKPGLHRPLAIPLEAQRRPINSQESVSRVLVEGPVVAENDVHHARVTLVHETDHFLGANATQQFH